MLWFARPSHGGFYHAQGSAQHAGLCGRRPGLAHCRARAHRGGVTDAGVRYTPLRPCADPVPTKRGSLLPAASHFGPQAGPALSGTGPGQHAGYQAAGRQRRWARRSAAIRGSRSDRRRTGRCLQGSAYHGPPAGSGHALAGATLHSFFSTRNVLAGRLVRRPRPARPPGSHLFSPRQTTRGRLSPYLSSVRRSPGAEPPHRSRGGQRARGRTVGSWASGSLVKRTLRGCCKKGDSPLFCNSL